MIKVQSLIMENNKLVPVEVELTLWPGLPSIQFLGRPDQHLKESSLRIKSAIKHSGFQFPVAQQILVNLRPSHLKKTSRGLELAVAVAFLWESGQVKKPLPCADLFVYGELSLAGEVLAPDDLTSDFRHDRAIVLTGREAHQTIASFRRQVIEHLKNLEHPLEMPAENSHREILRPQQGLQKQYSLEQSRLLEILALGGHSLLMAGPAGSGKTTVAQSLASFLEAPSVQDLERLESNRESRSARDSVASLQWWPVVKPHHSTPVMAMIGGGAQPFAGEISRAHRGILILDELLEFAPAVQEALREPFEEGCIRVARNGRLKEFPAQAQILATTNLCPCGLWTPTARLARKCGFSALRCRSYGPRLSGPLVDRFDLLHFTERIGDITQISGTALLAKIEQARSFKKDLLKAAAESTAVSASVRNLSPLQKKMLGWENSSSQRRKLASARVASTLADLDLSSEIRSHHIDEAVRWSMTNFERLQAWE